MKAVVTMILMIMALCISPVASTDTPSVGYEVGSCRALNSSNYNTTDLNLMLTWFRGFVSGSDFTANPHRNSVRLVDETTIEHSVSKFCLAHPDQNMLHAALNLVSELRRSDEMAAKAMAGDPLASEGYRRLPAVCQKIINAELACSNDALEIDTRANHGFIGMDQSNIKAAKGQLYIAMPHIAQTKGTSELDEECRTNYLAYVHGLESAVVRDIIAHGGNPSACTNAVRAADAASQ